MENKNWIWYIIAFVVIIILLNQTDLGNLFASVGVCTIKATSVQTGSETIYEGEDVLINSCPDEFISLGNREVYGIRWLLDDEINTKTFQEVGFCRITGGYESPYFGKACWLYIQGSYNAMEPKELTIPSSSLGVGTHTVKIGYNKARLPDEGFTKWDNNIAPVTTATLQFNVLPKKESVCDFVTIEDIKKTCPDGYIASCIPKCHPYVSVPVSIYSISIQDSEFGKYYLETCEPDCSEHLISDETIDNKTYLVGYKIIDNECIKTTTGAQYSSLSDCQDALTEEVPEDEGIPKELIFGGLAFIMLIVALL